VSGRATVRRPATFGGVGLFGAAPATCRVLPGRDGIRIVRVDLAGSPGVRADVSRVREDAGARNTTIEVGRGVVVATVEHLLSALAGLGVTDATVEVDSPEIPIGDGSSAFIVEAILEAGVERIDAPLEPVTVRGAVRVEGPGGEWVEAAPSDEASYEYVLRYPGHESIIPDQSARWSGDAREYEREIAPARTFCLEEEALAMRAAGLFEHLGPRDMLVLGEGGPIENALRFENEPARHKLLDLIGDLALVGAPILGRVVAHRSGHALNRELARRLVER